MIKKFSRLLIAIFLTVSLSGCATVPKDFLKPSQSSLQQRGLQSRHYETQNEKQIISACAGVLQDLGFTLDDSETELGLVVGSKDRDATDVGQVALASIETIIDVLFGSTSDAFDKIDKTQKIRASVVSKPSADGDRIVVRVTFQRIIWNKRGEISKMETLNDMQLYQGFFERLSKAIFLEAHEI